ncbi:carbamate kinase [Candidatus Acetothermia bacterium]|jgi:carbamate kinase|nr:carbamate kinase [Candidatus Acetothermia bacterium]MCI2426995.1 carbamate kinase [Candidatus Acetothermia bacterium]MCI2428437.1 carbamate kinase [Candidatus Acetothermia bacterium]
MVNKKIVVIALGGHAILRRGEKGTINEQLANVETTARQLAQMILSGKYQIVITHGNGPQVGNLLLQNEIAKDEIMPMPLYVCGAQTQGMIGYMIQQSLGNVLAECGRGDIPIATIVTQVVVDSTDPAFTTPSKPVGPFYDQEEAQRIKEEKGYYMKEDSRGGWRRVVPSPDPIKIHEHIVIKQLLDAQTIVIAAGGGGIPVIEKGRRLTGVDAVIDKDLAAARLATNVEAKILLILTDVDQVKLDYQRPQEKGLSQVTVAEAAKYSAEGHFAPGSMGPKVSAALRFIEAGGERAIITSLHNGFAALEGRAGTTITKG